MSQLPFSSAIQRCFSFSLLDLALPGREIPVLDEAGLHYHYFNVCTSHNRTINLTVWLGCNKPSFLTHLHEYHIFLRFLAHPGLQQLDSYLLFSSIQNSCSLHEALPLLSNEKRHSNFCYSCHPWGYCKESLAATQICFHRTRCFGFFPPCMSMEASLFSFWCDEGLWMGLHRAL